MRDSVCGWDGVCSEAAKKERLDPTAIVCCTSPPLTILAVDAPVTRQLVTYSRRSLSYLVKKVLLIFCVAAHRRSPLILSGLLSGGVFRNNWPFVLLLHLLLQPENLASKLRFHHPVFDSFSGLSTKAAKGTMVLRVWLRRAYVRRDWARTKAS